MVQHYYVKRCVQYVLRKYVCGAVGWGVGGWGGGAGAVTVVVMQEVQPVGPRSCLAERQYI